MIMVVELALGLALEDLIDETASAFGFARTGMKIKQILTDTYEELLEQDHLNTKVIYPYEKEEQDKLVAAFTEQKGNKLRFRYGWGAVHILETGLRAGEAQALE